MKHSILALAAAATLGMAGSAHAVWYVGDQGHKLTGERLRVEPNGSGHALIMPYFNAQGNTKTALHLTNTNYDTGKAVRVHVRGAANGDNLLDFTVLLGPGDVWTATLANSGGNVFLSHGDDSCVVANGKAIPPNSMQLSTDNLAPYLSDAAKKLHTGEGYIEFITMASLIALDNPLLDSDCSKVAALLSSAERIPDNDYIHGLIPPMGDLAGVYYVINQDKVAAYAGGMTAIRAVTADGKDGTTKIMLMPDSNVRAGTCSWSPCTIPVGIGPLSTVSADPLFTGKEDVPAHRLPDLSTPLLPVFGEPEDQIRTIAEQMGRKRIVNDVVSEPNGSVPMLTDWVISDPLRRYAVAVDYGASAAQAKLVENPHWTPYFFPGSPEDSTQIKTPYANMGPVSCVVGYSGFLFHDREKRTVSGGWANLMHGDICGAVSTFGFAQESPMNARATRTVLKLPENKTAGWVQFGKSSQYHGETPAVRPPLPFTGFAAFSAKNEQSGIIYSTTWPHR